jgi:hypothetical protein
MRSRDVLYRCLPTIGQTAGLNRFGIRTRRCIRVRDRYLNEIRLTDSFSMAQQVQ